MRNIYQEDFGPQFEAIQFVIAEQVPHLTKPRADMILMMSRLEEYTVLPQMHAFESARKAGTARERQMVQASEALRKSVWDVIWDSRWADAWHLSWIISNLGLGLATLDLVNDGTYTVADYMKLVGPWLTGGFGDMPIPRIEKGGLSDVA